MDYQAKFIAKSFENILNEKYKNNFKSISFESFCNNIDNKFIDYFRRHNSIDKDKDFKKTFFDLNKILTDNKDLKKYFPNFKRERGNISFKLLEDKEDKIEKIVEEVEKVIKEES